jgi:hypothetical protein
VVDTSGTHHAVEAVDGARAISNRPGIESFAAEHELRRDQITARVVPRLEASRAALAAGPASVAGLQDHLRSHVGGEDGWTICMHAPGQHTTASVVAELPAAGHRIAHVALGHPCRSIYVPLVVGAPLGEPPAWERAAGLPAAARDVLAPLEAALAAEVRPDPAWNAEAWARVTDALDRLGQDL